MYCEESSDVLAFFIWHVDFLVLLFYNMWTTQARYLNSQKITLNIPVSMQMGCFPRMHLRKVLNSHLNESSVSSPISATPKIVDCKWLLTPTNTARGIWYLLDLYVVSNVMQSPKSAYAALQLAFNQNIFLLFYAHRCAHRSRNCYFELSCRGRTWTFSW